MTPNVAQFVATAQIFENTGVMAYAGAVNTLASEILLTVAATIATVEARHAAYLNLLIGQSPFPSSFDNYSVPFDIVTAITPFITSCPYTLDASILPVPVSSLPNETASPGITTRPPGQLTAAMRM